MVHRNSPAWASGQRIKSKRNKLWRAQVQTILADYNMAGLEVMVDIDDDLTMNITTSPKVENELQKRLRRQKLSKKKFFGELHDKLLLVTMATPSNVRH